MDSPPASSPKRETSPKLEVDEDNKPVIPAVGGTSNEPVTIQDDDPMPIEDAKDEEQDPVLVAPTLPDASAAPKDDDDPDSAMPIDGDKDEEDDEKDEDEEPERRKGSGEEESEEDEDDDEEDGGPGERRPKKRRKRKEGANRFLDLEVEVDTDEEEEDEDEGGIEEGFIVGGERKGSQDIDQDEEEDQDEEGHRDLDQRRRDFEETKAEDLARELDERNRERRQRIKEAQEMGDGGLPRNALMPDVNDPTIWGLKVKRGREREIVMSIFRKAAAGPGKPQIISAFCRDSIEGYVYVESRSEQSVRAATYGIIGVYANNNLLLVPLEERADLLKTKKKDANLQEGGWVRIKRGKYAGDLAQIYEITESGEEMTLKYIPRIDFTPKEEGTFTGSDGRKRKKGGGSQVIGIRPAQALFNAEVVKRAFGNKSVTYQNREYHFAGDDYRDGYVLKQHRLNQVDIDNVNPTIDEITKFAGEKKQAGGEDEEEEGGRGPGAAVDYNAIAEAQRRAANITLQPGDSVEIFEGDQKGISGLVEAIDGDIVTLAPSPADHPELANTKVEVVTKSIRKRFKLGDHIKVMAGANLDESGLVTSIEGDVITFISDLSQEQKQVFSRDVREAAEVGANANVIGEYELHNLVLLDQSTSGVIFKIERDLFRVLDQTGTVRNVKPSQITGKIDSSRSIAADSQGVDIKPGDMVKETTNSIRGEGRTGRVLHVYRSLFAFLHNRDLAENGGVFVVNVRYLLSQQPTRTAAAKSNGLDLAKMNPNMQLGAMAPPPVPVGGVGRGPARDPIEGMRDVFVGVGPYKGHKGIVKDVNGALVRIELETTTKLVTIERAKLRKERPSTAGSSSAEKIPIDQWLVEYRSGPMRALNAPGQQSPSPSPGPYAGAGAGAYSAGGAGAANPYGQNTNNGRTPNPYAQPAGGLGGRTPNPYAQAGVGGGRTPNPYASNVGGKTPNPYASNVGGKTPNPYANNVGGKTPNPYSAGVGGKTPNPYSDGGATPLHSSSDTWNPSKSGASSSGKSSVWDASSKTPYTSNDDRAGGYGGGSSSRPATTPASIGTGAYGSFSGSGATPRGGQTPAGSYGGRSSYGGDSDRRSSGNDNVRFGTATNTAPLGAPSRYGARGDAPTPRGAPTPAAGGYNSNTPYGAPTPAADRAPYDAPTPGSRYDAPTPTNNDYYGAPTPGPSGAPTPGPSNYQRDSYDRGAADRPTPYNDYRTPAPPRGAPTPGHFPNTPAASYGTPRDYPAATPGAAYGATPYASAPTPAASGSSGSSAIPPDWPAVGLEVRIVRNAESMASFAGARFDDSRVVITAVPPHKPYEQNVVQVRLASHDGQPAPNMTLPPFPINYLAIVPPSESGQKAMVVGNGRYRKEIVTCKSLDEGSWLCGLQDGKQEVFEARLLCIIGEGF